VSRSGVRQLVATTAADETALGNTMIVTGTAKGQTVTETLTLPNASTVTSTKYFDVITDVTTTQNDAGNTKLGTNQIEVSEWVNLNLERQETNVGLSVNLSGTINMDVEFTLSTSDLNMTQSIALEATFDHDSLAALTASQADNIVIPVLAIRMRTNSFTSGATSDLFFSQSGPT